MNTRGSHPDGRFKLALLCAPIVGLLDNWLPVIARFHAKGFDAQVCCVFPGRWILEQMRANPALQEQAAELMRDYALVVSERHLVRTPRFHDLLEHSRRNLPWRLLERIWRPGVKSRARRRLADWGWALMRILPSLPAGMGIERISTLADSDALLFDIREIEKFYCEEIIKQFTALPAFSISHGLGLGAFKPIESNQAKTPEALRSFVDENVTALLLSPLQGAFYQHRYGLPEHAMTSCGIPRHDRIWTRQFTEDAGDLPAGFEAGFVFLISRPSTALLSPDRKRRQLEAIARQVQQRGSAKIVVKRHPKEKDESCFEQALGQENYGKTWIYSQNHPLNLGIRCRYAISFYSGIVIDLIWLGKPSIEYLDLRGNPGYDNEAAHRDEMGNPVLEYRFHNLVTGVQSEQELGHAIERLHDSRDEVLRELEGAYRRVFPADQGHAAEVIQQRLTDNSPFPNSKRSSRSSS